MNEMHVSALGIALMRMSITGATDENSMQMHEDDFNLEHISLGKSRNGVLNLYAIASLETCAIFTVFSEGQVGVSLHWIQRRSTKAFRNCKKSERLA